MGGAQPGARQPRAAGGGDRGAGGGAGLAEASDSASGGEAGSSAWRDSLFSFFLCVGMNPGIGSLKGNHKGWLIRVIPSFPAFFERNEVMGILLLPDLSYQFQPLPFWFPSISLTSNFSQRV